MGSRNWQLLRDLERAKKAGDTEQTKRLTVVVEESQQACEHPDESKRVVVLSKDGTGKTSKPMLKGDTIVWCLACSKLLRHIQGTR